LGILSIVEFTLFLGVVLGIIGIVMAVVSRKNGFVGGIRTAGLVTSIIGVALNAILLIVGVAFLAMIPFFYF
jgi:hypothetical protein